MQTWDAQRRRERRYWICAAALLAAYYAAVYPAQSILTALRERNLLRLTLGSLIGLVAVLLAWAQARSRPGWREWTLVAGLALVYVFLLARLQVIQERVHFLQYGALAALVLTALRLRQERRRRLPLAQTEPAWRAASVAALLTAAAGWGDEGIQFLIPSRVYDLRDVGFNALAGFLAAFGLEARRAVRRLDRRRMSMSRPGAAAVLALLAALQGGVGTSLLATERPAREESVAADARAAPAWSLLLITVDALRADHLGVYGYARPTSPRIDALAREGTTFVEATGVTAWTGPGILSLLLGQYPAVYGIDTRGKTADPFLPTPLAELARRGYRVEGFQSQVDPYRNLGFETIEMIGEPIEATLERRAAEPGRPFVLWHHIRSVHLPYACRADLRAAFDRPALPRLPADQLRAITGEPILVAGRIPWDLRARAHVEDLYDACVRQADEEVGRALDALRASGLERSTMVVLTADHGEELLDHGEVGHASTNQASRLPPEILDIPLIVRVPGLAAGRRVGGMAQAVDVMPTLFDLIGETTWPWFQGRSLRSSLETGAEVDRSIAFAETTRCGWQCGSNRAKTVRVRAARTRQWHLMEERDEHGARTGAWLFDRRSDPAALRDASSREPLVKRRLEIALEERSATDRDLAERLVWHLLAARRAAASTAPSDRREEGRVCDELAGLRDVYRIQNPSLFERRAFARRFAAEVGGIVERLGDSRRSSGYWVCRELLGDR